MHSGLRAGVNGFMTVQSFRHANDFIRAALIAPSNGAGSSSQDCHQTEM
jgi:hypothetical protein